MARIPFTQIEAWMAANNLRAADAADAFGVTSQTYNGWKSRGYVSYEASDRVAEIMADCSKVSVREMHPAYVRVVDTGGFGDMGEGAINDDFPEVIRGVDYTQQYIRGILGFVPPPGRLMLVTGRGDSMMPTIQPGESLLVDTGITTYDGDGIYLINLGHGQQIKRLADHGQEGIFVHSDNTMYKPIKWPRGAIVGGRVYLRNRVERFA